MRLKIERKNGEREAWIETVREKRESYRLRLQGEMVTNEVIIIMIVESIVMIVLTVTIMA